MARLRIRIELNKGRVGMPLGKLAGVSAEVVKFLNMFSSDLRLMEGAPIWLAEHFENSSVNYDCRLATELDANQAEIARRALRMLMSEKIDDPQVGFLIRPETRRQYFHIAAAVDPDEKVRFGVYDDGEGGMPDQWYELVRHEELLAEGGLIDRGAYGEVQGVVNAFFKEGKRPHLRIRELSTGQLVKCFFRTDMYQAAVELLSDREAVVFVEGYIREDSQTGETREIEVRDFRPAPAFSQEEFERFLGKVPDYTGDLTTEDIVESARERD